MQLPFRFFSRVLIDSGVFAYEDTVYSVSFFSIIREKETRNYVTHKMGEKFAKTADSRVVKEGSFLSILSSPIMMFVKLSALVP